MGIGRGIDIETLHQIAGPNNPVILVNNFAKLVEEIPNIRSKACSGEWSNKVAGDSGFLELLAV